MKEELYTKPLLEAFEENDECPFCYIERKLEQDALDFTLGTDSYMQRDIREQTDKLGFCRIHNKKMFAYGNSLGNALILQTHYMSLLKEFDSHLDSVSPQKNSFLSKFSKSNLDEQGNPLSNWVKERESTCYVCDYINHTYERYLATFFYLCKHNPEFWDTIANSKGFCLHHFGELTETATRELNTTLFEKYKEITFPLMKENLKRVYEDVSWFVDKFDYRNADADWKNSRDAVPRGMQKINGGYPAD